MPTGRMACWSQGPTPGRSSWFRDGRPAIYGAGATLTAGRLHPILAGRITVGRPKSPARWRRTMALPLMPKATAVWLVENTSLTFDQIAEFCGLHTLEVQAIAD